MLRGNVSVSVGQQFLWPDWSWTQQRCFYYVLLCSKVISCFTTAIVTYNYEGYAVMALLIEVNSVFLHIRQLMIIQSWDRETLSYRINSSLNLGTIYFITVVYTCLFPKHTEHSRQYLYYITHLGGGGFRISLHCVTGEWRGLGKLYIWILL